MTALDYVVAVSPLLVGLPSALGIAVALTQPARWVRPLAWRRWDVRL